MAIYDSMTPFEEEEDPVSSSPALDQLERSKHSSKSNIGADSQFFDVSAALYSHPQTVAALTPHQVLSRYDQPASPLTPHPVLLRNQVPELIHRHSSGSSSLEDIDNPMHCPSCGLRRAQSSSFTEEKHCRICADITRERECPDTQSPNLADVAEARSHEPSKHFHRRHSLFYEPSSNDTNKAIEALKQDLTPQGQESMSLDAEPAQLEHAHDYKDTYYSGAEERLLRQKAREEERRKRHRVQKARQQMLFGDARVASDVVEEISTNEAECRQATDHPEVTSEPTNHEYYYGKYI